MKDLTALAAQPADDDLLKRAREVCANRLDLTDELHALVTSAPTRASVHAFIERAKATLPASLVDRVDLVCKALRIEAPTGQERLLALQVLLMSEQAIAVQRLSDELKDSTSSAQAQPAGTPTSNYLLAGLVLGAVAAK